MEEFIVRNYVYHNLRDLLFRINKLHPDFLTEEYLALELERVRNHINSIKFTNTPDPIESLPKVSAEPIITTAKEPKAKRAPRKPKAESNVVVQVTPTQPLFTFDTAQFQVGPPVQEQVLPVSAVAVKTKKAVPSSDKVTSCQCAARVVGSSRNPMAHDYVSYGDDVTKDNPIYGRRCKNVMMDNGPFCAVHKKKCEYGIFTDEPSAEVRELCMKKYTRLNEIENGAQPTKTTQ